ncbi:hypothetical protein ACET3Z_001243 [Daucus carota]
MRSSQFGPGWVRSLMTDYGVPFLIVKWTAFTDLVPEKAPAGVPRRLRIPLPQYGNSSYSVHLCYNHPSSNDSSNDHSVASQMAQQKEFNLKNLSDYHYDVLLLGIMV